MPPFIHTVKSRVVYSDPDNPWVTLNFDDVVFPDGSAGRYNKIVEGRGEPGVAVLPISEQGVGFVRQFRYAIGKSVWEIPRGYGDSQDPVYEAIRELAEETGLRPRRMISLGVMHANSAILATQVELFAAECDPVPGKPSKDPKEACEFQWFAVDDALKAAENAELTDGFTLSALLRARLKGLI